MDITLKEVVNVKVCPNSRLVLYIHMQLVSTVYFSILVSVHPCVKASQSHPSSIVASALVLLALRSLNDTRLGGRTHAVICVWLLFSEARRFTVGQ